MQRDTRRNNSLKGKSTVEHSLGRDLRDGYEVHRAALARGLNVRLLPRQVMEVSMPGGRSRTVGFSHGVPQSTTLAGATYAQDLRMRRAMLTKAGFAVPRGATFSVGRSQSLARKFAARVGYPVALKPAVGDNTIEVATALQDRRELDKAIEYLYTPPSQRAHFTRAAYALTELREPGRINGKIVAPPGYRFLIEKHVHGQYLRFLIIDHEVLNILYCPDGPWETPEDQVQNITEETHERLKGIALRAARTVPGLSVVAIDIIVPDHREKVDVDDAQIVELSERPWLEVQHRYDAGLATNLADEMLVSALPEASGRQIQETVSSDVLIGGAVDPTALLGVLSDEFSSLGIEGNLEESDHALGQIRGPVTGAPEKIAWVMERIISDGINGQRAMLVNQQSCSA